MNVQTSTATSARNPWSDASLPLATLILFQIGCTLFFVWDVSVDLRAGAVPSMLMLPEIGATLGLILGIAVEVALLLRLLRRQARIEHSLGVASGALGDIIEGYFRDWSLTPAEADVATFAIKGYSIAEMAGLRGSAEGTIKTHLNAIYRKAGVPGRSQLVSLLVEDLLRAPLVPSLPSAKPRL